MTSSWFFLSTQVIFKFTVGVCLYFLDQLIKLRVAACYVHFYVHAILECSIKMASNHETSKTGTHPLTTFGTSLTHKRHRTFTEVSLKAFNDCAIINVIIVVGIATTRRDGLSGVRIPVGARSCFPLQIVQTVYETHPTSHSMTTGQAPSTIDKVRNEWSYTSIHVPVYLHGNHKDLSISS